MDLYIIIMNDTPMIDASGSVIYYPSQYDAERVAPLGAAVMPVRQRQIQVSDNEKETK